MKNKNICTNSNVSNVDYGNWSRAGIALCARGLGVVVMGIGAVVYATDTSTVETLQEVMQEVVSQHPVIVRAGAELEAARKDISSVRSGYFPVLSLNSVGSRKQTEKAFSDSKRTLWDREVNLTLTQPLFDGFETSSRVAQTSALARVAEQRVAQVKNVVGVDFASLYIDVLRYEILLGSAQDYMSAVEQEVARLEAQAQSDPGLASTVLVGRQQVIQARLRLEEIRSQNRFVRSRYAELVGRVPGKLAVPDEPTLPVTQEDALLLARSNHPLVGLADAQIAEREALVKEAKSRLLPNLDLEIKGRRARDVDGIRGQDNDASVGIRLTYEFATGGGRFSDVSASRKRLSAALSGKHETFRSVDDEVLRAYQNYQQRVEAAQLADSLLKNSTQLTEVFRGQFKAGQRSLTDFIFVLQQANTAKERSINTRFDRLSAAYQLNAAMGALGASL